MKGKGLPFLLIAKMVAGWPFPLGHRRFVETLAVLGPGVPRCRYRHRLEETGKKRDMWSLKVTQPPFLVTGRRWVTFPAAAMEGLTVCSSLASLCVLFRPPHTHTWDLDRIQVQDQQMCTVLRVYMPNHTLTNRILPRC